jgi:hypothetical protein
MRSNLLLITVAFAAGLSALAAAGAFVVGMWQYVAINRQAAAQLFDTAQSVAAYVTDQQLVRLELTSKTIAGNAGLIAAVAELTTPNEAGAPPRNAAPLHDLLDERRRDASIDAAVVLDANGKVITTAGENFLSEHDVSALPMVAKSRHDFMQASGTIEGDPRLPMVTVTPIANGKELIGQLVAGMRGDGASLHTMAGIAKVKFALIVAGPSGVQLANSTLDGDDAERLATAIARDQQRWRQASSGSTEMEIAIGHRAWIARSMPLSSTRTKDRLLALIPVARGDDVFHAIASPLIAATVAAALLILILSAILWRRGVVPLTAMTDLSARAARGDFALELKPGGFAVMRRVADFVNYLLRELDRHRVPHGVPKRRSTDHR